MTLVTPTRQHLAVCCLLMAACSDEDPYHGAASGKEAAAFAEHTDAVAPIEGSAQPPVGDAGLPSIDAAQAAEGGAADAGLPYIDAAQAAEGGADAGSHASSTSSFIDKANAAIAEDPGNLSCSRTFLEDSASGREKAWLAERTQIAAVLGVSAEQVTFSSSLPCGVATGPCASRFEHDALSFGGHLPEGLVPLVNELENTTSAGELTGWTWMQNGVQQGSLAAVCVYAPIEGFRVGVCVIGGGTCAARGLGAP